jgi:hypothetical protein
MVKNIGVWDFDVLLWFSVSIAGKVNNGNGNGSLWEASDEGQGGRVLSKSGKM